MKSLAYGSHSALFSKIAGTLFGFPMRSLRETIPSTTTTEHSSPSTLHFTISFRGNLTRINPKRTNLPCDDLHAEPLRRGGGRVLTGAHDNLLEVGQFVSVTVNRQGLKIACLEEIAYRQGWLDHAGLDTAIKSLGKSHYGAYLRRLATCSDSTNNEKYNPI